MIKKLFLLAALSAGAGLVQAAPNIQEQLNGVAAKCRIDGAMGDIQAGIAQRNHGEKSPQYKAAVETSFKDAKACVDREKLGIKPNVKGAIEAMPDLKPEIMDAYGKWLSYMDWLATPREISAESPESRNYTDASNRLKAAIELR
ncbi:hypothetical protein [Pseudomonas sp. LA5]|uniref:hypothetical protein n=1 Tax=Pseudomonas sp. LA5 TaxID=3027850 RepID=UPI00235FDE82|nr:hypothetical protein [Pseudomonas sp. LA5]